MKKILSVAIVLMVLSSCTSIDKEFDGRFSLRDNHIKRFYATTEQNSQETKVYADEDLKVLWNAGDLLSVFNQRTYNSKFEFKGEDGDNAGDFEDVTPSGLHSGNALDNIYAVYPYSSGNKINNAGNTITLTLPAEQQYKAHSFGIGANTMVAVTDDSYLAFKNLCGYLQLRLYGDNVKVSSIKIQGNNGEKIAGKANVAVGLGALPTVTMDETATDAITLVCDSPVQLGTTADNYTDFWFVIPPTTFSGGFTITVTDEQGGVFEKTTTKSLTIQRSIMEWMSALQVTPNYDNVNVVFEDANFKAYCVGRYDTNGDGEISMAEAEFVTAITVNSENVASLKGIEHFKNLDSLNCSLIWDGSYTGDDGICHFYYNNDEVFSILTSIDVSHNTKLKYLDCGANSFQYLDVSKNAELRTLCCDYNLLITLDLRNNTALTDLDCNRNQLTSLDVNNNTALSRLECSDNQLTRLDVSNNTELTLLHCMGNKLSSLDVSHNIELSDLRCADNRIESLYVTNLPRLRRLYCEKNQIQSLDVNNNTMLYYLRCNNNQLTSVDVSNNTALKGLYCYNNQLTSLDVSGNTVLTFLSCHNNKLTNLDVSKNTLLEQLYCQKNQLTSLDVSKNTALQHFGCGDNPDLTEIWLKTGQEISDFTYDTAVATIKYYGEDDIVEFEDAQFKSYCVGRFDQDGNGEITHDEACAVDTIIVKTDNISSLQGIEYFTNLKVLNCRGEEYRNGGKLTSLDVTHNTKLIRLICKHNQLTTLDVSNNIELTILDCGCNYLTNIDLSENAELYLFQCDSNQLTSLDISHNKVLKQLYCKGNRLTSLDVSKNFALTTLECPGNQLTSLDVSNNAALTSMNCDRNELTSIVFSNNAVLTKIHCTNNRLTSLDVSHSTTLKELWCYNNQLTSLDVSNNTALTSLSCQNNQLTSLDVGNNTALKEMWCFNNQLTSLDVSNNIVLTSLSCWDNQLSSLDVSNNTALTWLSCGDNQLTSLDVSNNTALTNFDCDKNQLTSLDVSNNTALTTLNCHNNQLTTLDVSNNLRLTQINCKNNPDLTEIWLKIGQTINYFSYDTAVATIRYKD